MAATTFWFFSALNKSNYTTRIQYPITFNYQADSIYVMEAFPEQILIEVTGGGWNLLRKTLLFDTPPVEITLEDPVDTKYITGRSIAEQIAERLGEVRLNYVVTDTLFINVDRAAEKPVYIALDSSSVRLGDTYQVISPVTLSTTQAMVQGPQTILAALPDTLYVNLPDEEITENYRERVPLDYDASDLLTIDPAEVIVSFGVAPFERATRMVTVSLDNFPKDSSLVIIPDQVAVSYWVRDGYDDLIQSKDFEVVANLRRLSLEDSTITPVLKFYPKFARDIAISPSKLRVRDAK